MNAPLNSRKEGKESLGQGNALGTMVNGQTSQKIDLRIPSWNIPFKNYIVIILIIYL
jgi:hypothetical protein